jgi:hypothetical protein
MTSNHSVDFLRNDLRTATSKHEETSGSGDAVYLVRHDQSGHRRRETKRPFARITRCPALVMGSDSYKLADMLLPRRDD